MREEWAPQALCLAREWMDNLHCMPQSLLKFLLEHWKGHRFSTGFAKLVGSKPGASGAQVNYMPGTVLSTEDTTTREETVQNKAEGW